MGNEQVDFSQFTPEFRKKLEELEKKKPEYKQLQALTDIADMVQELVHVADSGTKGQAKTLRDIGAVLTDAREQLVSLNKKDAPEAPDYATPVVEAVNKLEAAIAKELAKIDVKPHITLPAPQVKVDAPKVNVPKADFSKIEKLIKDLPAAFEKAVKKLPAPPKTDNTPLLEGFQQMNDYLESIEHQSRLKPLPGVIDVHLYGYNDTLGWLPVLVDETGALEGISGGTTSNTYGSAVYGTGTYS